MVRWRQSTVVGVLSETMATYLNTMPHRHPYSPRAARRLRIAARAAPSHPRALGTPESGTH